MEEMEATLRVKIKEIQIEGEDGEATKTFEKNLHRFQVHRNQELKDAEVEQLENAIEEKALKRIRCYQDPRIVEEVKRSLSFFV